MIKAQNINKSFDTTPVLKDVSLSVGRGEFVSIMGRSGSGKSTLLGILAGNIIPDSGSVLLDGEDIFGMSNKQLSKIRRTKLGFVYQSLNLIPTLNAKDNILLPLYLNRDKISDSTKRLDEITQMLEIHKLLQKYPSELSGGERQRVAIAKSLLHNPEVIMLDEPTGSLDVASSDKVMDMLLAINKDMGVSVIQVTHNPETAKVSDRIIYISDGCIKDGGV